MCYVWTDDTNTEAKKEQNVWKKKQKKAATATNYVLLENTENRDRCDADIFFYSCYYARAFNILKKNFASFLIRIEGKGRFFKNLVKTLLVPFLYNLCDFIYLLLVSNFHHAWNYKKISETKRIYTYTLTNIFTITNY